MLEGGRDDQAIADAARAFGLEAQIEDEAPVDVWPEHWQAMEVFTAMSTQLSVSGSGAVIGYQYVALPVVMDLVGVPADRRASVFADFRVLETEARLVFRRWRDG